MALDPRYDSRLLAQGTTQAEVIYNELIARQAAAHMRLKSRTTITPPGSPATFDAYFIPAGAAAPWDAFVGDIAIYLAGWVYMQPEAGMRYYIDNEGLVVDWHDPIVAGSRGHALTGHYTITPVADNVTFDGSLGVSADVVLTGDGIMQTPVNLVSGRVYTIYIKQPPPNGGSHTLDYEALGWISSSPMALSIGSHDVDVYTFIGGNLNYPATEIARNLDVQVS